MKLLLILGSIIIIILDIIAIAIVIYEDILYSNREKFHKILFILFIPIIGAIIELYKNSKTFDSDTNSNINSNIYPPNEHNYNDNGGNGE